MKLILIIVMMMSNAFAQQAEVLIVDPLIDSKELEGKYKVQRGSQHKSSLPNKAARDAYIGHLPQVKDWSEFEKDRFYMRLEYKKLKDLEELYPQFSPEQLAELKKGRL